jgi:hypothetical protein
MQFVILVVFPLLKVVDAPRPKESNAGEDVLQPERYFNLSCPFEWSKYSCAHQGKTAQAEASQRFAAAAYGQVKMLNRRVLMIGDSTMRQLFISVGCAGVQNLKAYNLDWAQPYRWPCLGSLNCYERGIHSGFNIGQIQWGTGGEVHFAPQSGSLKKKEKNILNRMMSELDGPQQKISFGEHITPYAGESHLGPDDVIIYNAGYHDDMLNHKSHIDIVAKFGQKLRSLGNKAPVFVYITTPGQHFDTPTGAYRKGFGKKRVSRRQCKQEAFDDSRSLTERSALSFFETESRLMLVESIDLHSHGDLHVGEMQDVDIIDCTHYCQPGVPDVQAQHLFDEIALRLD